MVWGLLRAPVIFFDSTPIGHIMTRFSNDIMVTDFMLPKLIDTFLVYTFKVLSTMIFMIVTVPFNGISMILIFIPMYFVRKHQKLAQVDCQRVESSSKGPMNTRYTSVIDGISSIRVYHLQEFFTEGFMIDSDINSAARFTLAGVTRWFIVRLDFLATISIITSMLTIILMKQFTSFLDLTMAALAVQFSVDFSYSMGFSLKTFGKIENKVTSSQRVIEYTALDQEDDLVKPNDHNEWAFTPDITFEDVYMKYKPNLPLVLKGISHYIQPRTKVGIIGRTGAGKSSILQAIFRLSEVDQHSKIIIGGLDIKEIGLHCLRQNVSYIPQSPFLMTDTIRANMDPPG